jgi:hypothetical protein
VRSGALVAVVSGRENYEAAMRLLGTTQAAPYPRERAVDEANVRALLAIADAIDSHAEATGERDREAEEAFIKVLTEFTRAAWGGGL